jgi:DivIVA domain-containing protein
MPITSADVRSKEFPLAFRGYAVDDVDAFLGAIETELDRLASQSLPPVDGTAEDPSSRSLAVLRLAQQTADAIVAEAHAETAKLRAAAVEEAELLRARSAAEAERIVSEAQVRAEGLVADARAETARLTADLSRLQHLHRTYRDRLQLLLSEQQRLLDEDPPVALTLVSSSGD